MTENEYQEMPMPPYDHGAVMKMRNVIIESFATKHDPVYLVCAYLQQAVEPSFFNKLIEIMQIPDDQIVNYINNALLADEEQK